MVYLDLRDALQQSLLEYYLSKHGYCVASGKCWDEPGQAGSLLVVITDDFSRQIRSSWSVRLVWLVDCRRQLPEVIPDSISGMLSTSSLASDIDICLRQIEQGKHYVDSQLLKALTRRRPATEQGSIYDLSKREREVFTLMQRGLTCIQIADQLFISAHTVENHRANIQRKLGLSGRYSLIRYAATSEPMTN